MTPKCLWVFTLSMKLPLNTKGGELLSNLFVKIISLDFPALNITFHLFAQTYILFRSLFKISAVSVGSFPWAKREQSSAKIRISLSSPSTISLI